jgi:uncharacterized protein
MIRPLLDRPLYVMLKPVGSRCNLACQYCYYQDKGTALLSEELLETFTRQYLEAQVVPQVLFTWHGGEPLLRPLSFYKKALALQRRYARGRHIDNCLQTNGTLLTDEWCEFLRENNFLVGISIDGPQALHDTYRRTKPPVAPASPDVPLVPSVPLVPDDPLVPSVPSPSWDLVMRGIALLKKHGVQWNAMATVNAANVAHPKAFYRFFLDLGCEFLQFTPVVSRYEIGRGYPRTPVPPTSLTPHQWGHFLCTLYDEWVRNDVQRMVVQLFDATLANWIGVPPSLCSMAPTCGQAAVMEADGSVYSCDHFVFPEYRLGNIREHTITQLLYSERQRQFGLAKRDALTRQCRECPFLFACHGECPKNRFVTDCYGNPGHNYLCAGYRQFFAHLAADPYWAELQTMVKRTLRP